MPKKQTNYTELARRHAEVFATLEIAPEKTSTFSYSDIDDKARELRTAIEKFRNVPGNGSKEPGHQPYLSDLWEGRLEAISEAVSFLKDLGRPGFELFRRAWVDQNTPSHPKHASPAKSKTESTSEKEEEKNHFHVIGFRDDQIRDLTQEDILKEVAAFRKYAGPRDAWGYMQYRLFREEYSRESEWRRIDEAFTALKALIDPKDPKRFEAYRKKCLKEDKVAVSDALTFRKQLQVLVSGERTAIYKGGVRVKTPVLTDILKELAKILEQDGLAVAGRDLSGLNLRAVDCSGITFSGSNLSGADLRKAKVTGDGFDRNTIVSPSTKLEGIIVTGDASGLIECLEANIQRLKYRPSGNNLEAVRLLQNLRSRQSNPAPVQNGATKAIGAGPETFLAGQAEQPGPVQPDQVSQDSRQAKSVNAKPAPKKQPPPMRALRKAKREKLAANGNKHRSPSIVTPSETEDTSGASLPSDAVSHSIDGEIEEIRLAGVQREVALNERMHTAAGAYGIAIDLGGSAIDEMFAEPDRGEEKTARTAPVSGKEHDFSADLGGMISAIEEATSRITREYPRRTDLIQQKARTAVNSGVSRALAARAKRHHGLG